MAISDYLPSALSKHVQVILFSSTAIALYGYDQGMMSLINTNYNYLATMGIAEDDPLVGVIVSVYYLGCAVGAVIASLAADVLGRKRSIFLCLATCSAGNLLMFIAGLGKIPSGSAALSIMFTGRIVMGLGVGGIDAVVPVYTSELASDESRGKSLAQEFQANILGLNLAFAANLALTHALGKHSQWAWRLPIVFMQVFPLSLMAIAEFLPETPRFFILRGDEDEAAKAMKALTKDDSKADELMDELKRTHENESDEGTSYFAMMFDRSSPQFHATMLTIMAQVNQALTGYGAVSVYGPQIFELLGFGVSEAEFITQGNYISYLLLMTFAWLLIDAVGRRPTMLWGSGTLIVCFLLLALLGGLAQAAQAGDSGINGRAVGGVGAAVLFVATGAFGIGWLPQVFLIPTEHYPTSARARGTSISIIIWGLANFVITLITPVLFNNLKFWLFAVFAATNLFAGWFTLTYQPETGARSFEENQDFFFKCKEQGTWKVSKVDGGKYRDFPPAVDGDEDGERRPLLDRVRDQV